MAFDVTANTGTNFNVVVGAPPANPVYIGAGNRATRYVGNRSDANIYLGTKTLWP